MKKNKMMRLASVLLVAVLLTTCAISGTWAKYTTNGVNTASARVAKWGVEVTAGASTFAQSYNETGSVTVLSDTNVVAPGTKGNLATFDIDGSPEVAVEVKYAAELTLTGWTLADSSIYCPIVFTVGTTDYSFRESGHDSESLDDFAERVETAIEAVEKTYAVNETIQDVLVVKWSWAIDVDDEKDTYLGDQAANSNASTISLEVTCTVNQKD